MSKKRKNHSQNYTYHLEAIDTYHWEDRERTRVSEEYDDEAEAIAAAKQYAIDNDISSNPFTKIEIVRALKEKPE
jgi:hypothetical protein